MQASIANQKNRDGSPRANWELAAEGVKLRERCSFRTAGLRHLNLNDVVLDGVNNQVADGVQSQLPHYVAAMCLHCFGAQVQK